MADGVRAAFDAADPVLAAAAWSRLTEPGDRAAATLIGHLGAVGGLAWLLSGAAEAPGAPAAAWARARERWLPRLAILDPRRELDALARLGGRLVLATDAEWPVGLADLGAAVPHCLWVRGGPLRPLLDRSAAVVGARACTGYGQHVAAELGAGLAEREVAVVSGGAYGIDAAAHRGALAAGGATVAVLACGVDRPYPAGNAELLAEIGRRGCLVSEIPPGSAPSRSRFLMRNRLIAAMTRGTVVVEAAWRSGALSTATHAAGLLRPVGAVPGPVTSMASAGCHRLLREHDAVCVTDAAEVVELVGELGVDLAPDTSGGPTVEGGQGAPPPGLEPRHAQVFEALPLRGRASAEGIARTAGVGLSEATIALAFLELAGHVQCQGGTWRRTDQGRGAP
jgi:DNA processing protein